MQYYFMEFLIFRDKRQDFTFEEKNITKDKKLCFLCCYVVNFYSKQETREEKQEIRFYF